MVRNRGFFYKKNKIKKPRLHYYDDPRADWKRARGLQETRRDNINNIIGRRTSVRRAEKQTVASID